METKLDSRQGQFPATFPDTFKDFFAMMNEDEDHMDLFSNLLEDKVIPRSNKFNQRRCGGSLRCPTNPHNSGGGLNGAAASSSVGLGAGGGGVRNAASAGPNVGRSNSFRVNRPRTSYGGINMSAAGFGASASMGSGGLGNTMLSGSGSSLFCKHIKYCCLHQTHPHSHNAPHQPQQQQILIPHNDFGGPVTTTAAGAAAGASTKTSTRLGPDGEDNSATSTGAYLINDGGGGGGGVSDRHRHQHAPTASSSQQQQQQQQYHSQKRHSIILERAFDFDASCDESDTLSIDSSMPPPPPKPTTVQPPASSSTLPPNPPYGILKPILKQPQQQHQHHHQQQQHPVPPPSHQQQQQSQHDIGQTAHRSLPQPPKGAGAYHTKEAALQRIQQQSGRMSTATSKTNLASLMAGSTMNLNSGAPANTTNAANNNNNSIHYSGGGGGGGGSNYNLSGVSNNGPGSAYMDLHSPTQGPAPIFNDLPTTTGNSMNRNSITNIRSQKSPILARRRSSSIVANLLTADIGGYKAMVGASAVTPTDDINTPANMRSLFSGSNAGLSSLGRDRFNPAKSPVNPLPPNVANRLPLLPLEVQTNTNQAPSTGSTGVLTFQQAMSGAVSPQYTGIVGAGGVLGGGGGMPSPMIHMRAGGLDGMRGVDAAANTCNGGNKERKRHGDGIDVGSAHGPQSDQMVMQGNAIESPTTSHARYQQQHERTVIGSCGGGGGGVGGGPSGVCMSSSVLNGSSATIGQLGNRQRQRMRTSSMPAESRKPRLADTRRAAIHCADIDLEYYRLRSFSITSHGVCNLGDSLRSRRSRSINSVTSTGTSNSGKDRHNSNASRTSGDITFEQSGGGAAGGSAAAGKGNIPAYKVAMLGASGVGKTTLTYQFTTSDYICAYDLSLDDDYGQKTVSVLVDDVETDLEVIDHPACEMSTEAFCSTYNIDLFVVVYSVVDRASFKAAEKVLLYLKENEMLLTRGAILVGNKTDLERHREVNRQMARKLAKDIPCKFIETSSGLDHNVDELLVGIVAQVKLNPQRIRNLSEKERQRLNLQSTIQKHRRMHLESSRRHMVRQLSMHHDDDEEDDDELGARPHDGDGGEDGGGAVGGGAGDENFHTNTTGDEGIGTGSERTASTSLSSGGRPMAAAAGSSGATKKSSKRTLNLESILKMGESELEDDDEMQRQYPAASHYSQQQQQPATATGSQAQQSGCHQRPVSKFELLTSSYRRTPFGSLNSSPKSRQSYESSSGSGRSASAIGSTVAAGAAAASSVAIGHYNDSAEPDENLLDDGDDAEGNRKTVSKLTSRTKVFLSSVLRFKKAIHVKRRNSSSCSDLFVI